VADLFYLFAAVRVNGQQVARSWTQFESQLPQWKIEPVSVEVKENDTELEGYPVFEKLVKLSGIDSTPEEVIKDLWFEKFTNSLWELKFWSEGDRLLEDWFWLCLRFLQRNYHRRRAYVKVGDREIYWLVSVGWRRFHMKTPEWTLIMPSMCIADTFTGENKYVFFPMSALLKEEEQALFELYKTTRPSSDTSQLEMQIMSLLEKLTMARSQKPTISETNNVFSDIEEMCRASWTIKRLSVVDWRLVLEFDWRKVIDTDHSYGPMVLPPCKLLIDLRNYTVRWEWRYHPHIMGDNSLCMGWTLTDLVQKCITNRDLKTLVGWMIDFGNSWTSSDAMGCDRCPAGRIERYYENEWINWENIPIDLHDIARTFEDCSYSTDTLWSTFNSLIEE